MGMKTIKKILCIVTATALICCCAMLGGCKADGGSPAATWRVNASAPTSDTKGNVGDMWLDTSTYDIYQLTKDGWTVCGNTKPHDGKDGTDGENGKDGTDGKDGANWFTGEGKPDYADVEGNVGDFYLDTLSSNLYKKSDDGRWNFLVKLSAVGEDREWDDDGVLKILMIGNSFSDDTSCYMYHIAKNAMANEAFGKDVNIKHFKIATVHKANCTLDIHLMNAINDTGAYNFRVTDDTRTVADSPVSINSVYDSTDGTYKLSAALTSDNWDFISFQEFSSDFSYTALPELIEIVRDYCPTAKLVWHMTWAYQQTLPEGYTIHPHLQAYDGDQIKMYNALVVGAQNAKANNPEISIIAPTGTAIQNARATSMGDNMTRDGYHLSGEGDFVGIGTHNARYIAALCFFGKLSGADLSKITYRPTNVTEADGALSIQAAISAIEHPYTISD